MWDPRQYALFGTHRGRPFADLLARVDAPDPHLVVADRGVGVEPLGGLGQHPGRLQHPVQPHRIACHSSYFPMPSRQTRDQP